MASRSLSLRQFACLLMLAPAACTTPQQPVAAPAPATAPPPPAATVHQGDWRDWPLTAGTWRYRPGTPISSARYGEPTSAQFVVQCDAATRRVTIMRAGTAAEMTIIASMRTAKFPTGHIDDGGVAMSGVVLNANDAFLDVVAFSRGRIAITSPGLSSLAIPAWAEPARAIEDCRK